MQSQLGKHFVISLELCTSFKKTYIDGHYCACGSCFSYLEFNSLFPYNLYNKVHNKALLFGFQIVFNDEKDYSIKRIQFATKQFPL